MVGRRILVLILALITASSHGMVSQAQAQDRRLVAKWEYVSAAIDDHRTGAEGSLDLMASGRYADTRRIQGPRTSYGADTDGTWAASGDELQLRDNDGKVVGRMTFFVGSTERNGRRYAALTLKGDGLTYLLVHRTD